MHGSLEPRLAIGYLLAILLFVRTCARVYVCISTSKCVCSIFVRDVTGVAAAFTSEWEETEGTTNESLVDRDIRH